MSNIVGILKSIEGEFYSRNTEKWGLNLLIEDREGKSEIYEFWLPERQRYALTLTFQSSQLLNKKTILYISESYGKKYIKYFYIDDAVDFNVLSLNGGFEVIDALKD